MDESITVPTDPTTYVQSEQYQVSYEEATLQKERRMRCIEAAVEMFRENEIVTGNYVQSAVNTIKSAADDFYLYVEDG